MGRKATVPITPAVLDWAIAESGLSLSELATGVGVDEQEVLAWRLGEARPATTELRRLAKKLHRQVAVFFLPSPPPTELPQVQFRHPIGAQSSRALTADERRFLRRAKRLQEAEAWLVTELERDSPDFGQSLLTEAAGVVAKTWRDRLGVAVATQESWRSASAAFDAWRAAVEATGVTVLQLSMGSDSCRGFSIWDERAPLIAVNTAWVDEARIFTLFHELGHLVTRTNSACEAAPMTAAGDSTERWCEAFSAALLIPQEALFGTGRVTKLATLSRLARRLKVSLRTTAIRLIDAGKASWSLYNGIPPFSDSKKGGGGAGGGRNRREIREDEFGARTTEVFASAVRREIITESQALDYLDIPSSDFERLVAVTSR